MKLNLGQKLVIFSSAVGAADLAAALIRYPQSIPFNAILDVIQAAGAVVTVIGNFMGLVFIATEGE